MMKSQMIAFVIAISWLLVVSAHPEMVLAMAVFAIAVGAWALWITRHDSDESGQ